MPRDSHRQRRHCDVEYGKDLERCEGDGRINVCAHCARDMYFVLYVFTFQALGNIPVPAKLFELTKTKGEPLFIEFRRYQKLANGRPASNVKRTQQTNKQPLQNMRHPEHLQQEGCYQEGEEGEVRATVPCFFLNSFRACVSLNFFCLILSWSFLQKF
jgi:hypothetical protein